MIKEAAEILLPRECLVCGDILSRTEKHLCLRCLADLPLTLNWLLPHNPMADSFNATLERRRKDGESMAYAFAASLLYYHRENPFKAIPQAIKYHQNLKAGKYFASMLGRYLHDGAHWADVDTVIPVPLHWMRYWKRGYNQAAVIAGEIASSFGAGFLPHALRRRRSTSSQTALDSASRLENVTGAFEVNPGTREQLAEARHIVLVDDTFTTGATLAACHEAIRAVTGKETRISAVTLAVVDD